MSQESVILEFISRVQKLENRVEVLEQKLEETQSEDKEVVAEEKSEQITRSMGRENVMKKLREFNKGLEVDKATRTLGSGIVMKQGGQVKLKAKFYYSKSHLDHISSWHTVHQDEIHNANWDVHIFTVSYQGKFHTFFFTHQELKELVKSKHADNASLYHFYFHNKESRMVENRDNEINVDKYYERWTLPSELLKTTK